MDPSPRGVAACSLLKENDVDHNILIETGFYYGLGASWALMLNAAFVWLLKRIAQHISWRKENRKRQSK